MADVQEQEVSNEITLEDFKADEQEAKPSKEAPAKDPSPEPEKEKPEAKEPEKAEEPKEAKEPEKVEPPELKTKDDTDKPEKAEETPEKTSETPKADERKAQLNTEIRDLVAQRNALKAEVEKANAEVYQVATEDELTEQGMSAVEAKVEAMRQERELEKYNSQVADAQLTLGHESQRVLNDFSIFNPDSEDYDKELADEAAALLEANLIIDENTKQVIGSNVSPYQLYKTIAKASGISAAKGQVQAQKATEQMLANADAPASTPKPEEKVDPLIALWRSDD